MSEQFVTPVEPASLGAQKPFHPGDQIALRRFHHQMKRVAHQTQGMNLPAGLDARFAQRGDEPFPVSSSWKIASRRSPRFIT
jgi:hypothetical protein